MTEPTHRDLLATKRTALASERTLLAAERTFLAWLRTGMAGLGGGILVTRLLVFENYSHWVAAQIVGHCLMLWGMGLFIYALVGYNRIRKMIEIQLGYKTSIVGYAAIIGMMVFFSLILLVVTFLRI